MIIRLYLFSIFLFQWKIQYIHSETVHGCTINNNIHNNNINNNQRPNKTSVTLSCPNNGYILVQNLTFGVHHTSKLTCSYEPGDCTIRTPYIGMECNGLQNCNLDLNPQYLHICSQYSDYMVLDYLCLPGESLSICDNRLIMTTAIDMKHRLLIRSPNYPNEYENSLNCSCKIETKKGQMKFLDFYLEEHDEMNICTRDYLQIENQSYCDSTINQMIDFNSSIELIFKTNDVITRKGFWLMINSDQSIQVSCRNSFESPFPTATTTTTTMSSLTTMIQLTSFNTITNSSHLILTRRYTLSFILILIIIFVVVLLLLNFLLIILCWKQRQTKESINSKTSTTNRPFFCSKRSETSSTSSITYGETSLDIQKRQTTSTTTATTGIYEDPNEVLTLQQQKFQSNPSLYLQNRHQPKTFCPIILPSCSTNTGYNPMIHYSVAPMHCHFDTTGQTFYPLDYQHVYETIQDGQCPYQRLATTLRRQQQCTCYCTHNEQKLFTKIDDNDKSITIESNPETLV